jgi:hypothetical protein
MKELRQETFTMKFMNMNEMEINKWESLSIINELRYICTVFKNELYDSNLQQNVRQSEYAS